ncbi:MAG: hypothetical protein H7A51_07575 [Akkermansiaceae bacterium]|nr:hypothetical protein [Akkermansiaceae bacterium]
MHPKDIFLYLIGNRAAIERIAGSWWSLLIGAILVVTSGIARNYDHLDLLRNPEWLYGPFLASLCTSLIVFISVKSLLRLYGPQVKVKRRQYFSFLCLYWMTAPCAWLYGIPVESCTDLVTATRWNIAFLAIVSVWRVALITRSLSVVTHASHALCLLAVLIPSAIIMCIGSFFKGLSLVGIMGGVRLPPHTELLREATSFTMVASFWLAVVAIIIALTGSSKFRRASAPLPWRTEKPPGRCILTSAMLLAMGAGISIPTQQQVQRNHRLTQLIKDARYTEAIQYASQFNQGDFSTIHYLPPDPYLPFPHGNRNAYRNLLANLRGSEPAWLIDTWTAQYAETLLHAEFGVHEQDPC